LVLSAGRCRQGCRWPDFGVDRTLIRVIFVVLNLLGGAGIVLYRLLWIIVPNEPEGAA
jgi:phage shock protein PspC (stress-responsive transcriptional regulator)